MIFRSLWYDRWINFAVMLGVVCATAVLTGALLVGDSMRGSLRALTLDRLGKIDTMLQGASFFAPPEIPLEAPWKESEAAILLPAAVEANGNVSGTQLLTSCNLRLQVFRDEIIINAILAERLKVKPGDTISLRFNSLEEIPPDSALGRRQDTLIRSQLKLKEIIPDTGIGRFSLKADQQAEPLCIVPLDWLQRKLGVDDKVNTVFFETDSPEIVSTPEQRERLEEKFKPTLDDLGISVDGNYVKSARMMFTKEQGARVRAKWGKDAQPALVYLATKIRNVKNNRETPYSTVVAIDLPKEPGMERTRAIPGLPAPEKNATNPGVTASTPTPPALFEIALNRWTADDLDAKLGDEIELSWFEPESVHGKTVETSQKFTLMEINEIYDPKLVPEVKGFTDEVSIADWNPPFPFDAKKIRKKDEDYWDKHRAAPKAFVPLEIGQKLWGSRFGDVTTYRVENGELRVENFASELPPSLFGLNFLPVKEQGLKASAGTTPFSVLFLSFSFFIIAAALMLVLMLFRLSVEIKARRIGILLAVGWTRQQVARSLVGEGFIVALIGSAFGVLLGLLYARLIVYGLTTWWVDAITVPFLKPYVNPLSLAIGFGSGVVLSVLTILWSVRGVTKIPVNSLLHGEISSSRQRAGDGGVLAAIPGWVLETLCVVYGFFMILSVTLGQLWLHDPVGRAGFFFGVGALTLVFCLGQIYYYQGIGWERSLVNSPFSFAVSNMSRNRTRSTLCIGLVASTLFLVVSVGAFRLQPLPWSSNKEIVETNFPVYDDLNTTAGRENLPMQSDDEDAFVAFDVHVQAFRVKDGDNAGCLNLYQPNSPRILGVPKTMQGEEPEKTWDLIKRPLSFDSDGIRRVPILLDANTAMYSLHLYGGIGEVYEMKDSNDRTFRCEIVGLLDNSLFQGDILMGESNLLELFPEIGGYRFFLFHLRQPTSDSDRWFVPFLYRVFSDYGVSIESKEDRLRKLFAIQNTYLSTFQSLGGIGLLLGVFGLAVIQSRNVLERRKELALLQAVGFTKSRVILLLLYESFTLLGWGLGLAVVASAFALFPFLLGTMHQISPEAVLRQFVLLVGGLLLVGVVSNVAAALAVLKIPVARELAEER